MEQGWRMRENRHELKHGKFRLSVRKTVLRIRTPAEVQADQKEHAVSIPGCFQDSTGQSPEKSSLASA